MSFQQRPRNPNQKYPRPVSTLARWTFDINPIPTRYLSIVQAPETRLATYHPLTAHGHSKYIYMYIHTSNRRKHLSLAGSTSFCPSSASQHRQLLFVLSHNSSSEARKITLYSFSASFSPFFFLLLSSSHAIIAKHQPVGGRSSTDFAPQSFPAFFALHLFGQGDSQQDGLSAGLRHVPCIICSSKSPPALVFPPKILWTSCHV